MLFKSFALHKFAQNLFIFPSELLLIKKKKSVDESVVQTTCCVDFTSLAGNAFVMVCQVGKTLSTLCAPATRREGSMHRIRLPLAKTTLRSHGAVLPFHKRLCCDPGMGTNREQKHRLVFALCGITAGGVLSTPYGLVGRL